MLLNLIIWLLVGGIIGWIASLIMGTDGRQGLVLNIIVGVVGSFLAGLVLTPVFKIATIDQGNFSFSGLVMSLLGAILLLGVVNLFRRWTIR